MIKGLKKVGALILALYVVNACNQSGKVVEQLTLTNNSEHKFTGLVEINKDQLSRLLVNDDVIVYQDDVPVASQWSDTDGDGITDVLCANVNINPKTSTSLFLGYPKSEQDMPTFEAKTQAELWHKTTGKFKEGRYVGGGNFSKFDSLRVPDGFMDHAYFIKYEGPGWESNKVGYRLYLDWRNAIDVFGKRVEEPVLEQVGMDGYESYHHLQDWGMDVLKVGSSLGIGSTAWWNGEKAIRVEKTDSVSCKIFASGTIRSQVKIWYNGWQLDSMKTSVVSLKTIDAESRLTHEQLSFDKPVNNICTGIRKEPNTEKIELTGTSGEYACLATWGEQSLNKDNLGLAVLYRLDQKPRLTEDKNSHVVVFEEMSSKVDYYFLAAWELEKEGIKTKEEFVNYLNLKLDQLENPISITNAESIK